MTMSRTPIVALLALALVVAACSSGGDSSFETDGGAEAPTTTSAAGEPERPGRDEGAPTPPGGEGGSSGGVVVIDASPPGRDIIYTATVAIAVDDVNGAGIEATTVIEALGGYLFGQSSQAAPDPVTVLTFKVPPNRFREALAALGEVGELRSQTISADDVTERVVDLRSRIDTTVASVDRLRALIDQAADIDDIVALERELSSREAELESLRGQLRTLEDAVALATIHLTITEAFSRPGLSLSVTAYAGVDGTPGAACPGSANLSVEEGDDVTLCFHIRNTGDTALIDFAVADTVLGVELGDLDVVFGEVDAPLEPGQSIMLAHTTTVERTLQTRTRVTAVPVGPDGSPLVGRAVTETVGMAVMAVRPAALPGFTAGFRASVDALEWLWDATVLAVGLALPFLVVFGGIGAGLWVLLRRRPGRSRGDGGGDGASLPAPDPAGGDDER